MTRKKVKQEFIEDDISSVNGESELEDYSVDSQEMKGLSQIQKEKLLL